MRMGKNMQSTFILASFACSSVWLLASICPHFLSISPSLLSLPPPPAFRISHHASPISLARMVVMLCSPDSSGQLGFEF